MPRRTEIVIDDAYEEMAATFQCLQIERLNDVLIRSGVTDRQLRMNICGEYAASVGALLDQSWFEAEGRKVYPTVAFSTEFTGDSADPQVLGTLFWRSPSFAFTEYAYGDVRQFFEEENESVPVSVGNVHTDNESP